MALPPSRTSSRTKTGFRLLGSLPVLGTALFAFSVAFPPLEDATALSLTLHMLEHVSIIVSGVLIGYPLYKRGTFSRIKGRTAGLLALLAVSMLITLWHLPILWDDAVLNPLTHAAEHISFLAAGLLIGSLVLMLSDGMKVMALLLGLVGHFFYGLILTSNSQVYPLYSLSQQGDLGLFVFAMDPIFIFLIFFILWNPNPSENLRPDYLLPSLGTGFSRNVRRVGVMTPILTVILLASLIGFYSWSIAAVSFSTHQYPQHGSVVYIVETPVTWQYSPDSIKVLVGVNNTVTWISHSLAYDTVTGVNGSFSSGQIAPGQAFTYTFSQPGTYQYHCIYHPWMVGYVTVLTDS
jgi:plastocyanin